MADIIINRCTLRLVRRNGWSWGATPRSLLKAAVAALPLLIAQRLSEFFPDDSDIEVHETVRLTVPIKLSDLRRLTEQVVDQDSDVPVNDAVLNRHINKALADVLAALKQEPTAVAQPISAEETVEVKEPLPTSRRSVGIGVFNVLCDWKRRDELNVHLSTFAAPELWAWGNALLKTIKERLEMSQSLSRPLSAMIVDLLKEQTNKRVGDRQTSYQRVLLLFELAESLQGDAINEASILRVAEQVRSLIPSIEITAESSQSESRTHVRVVEPSKDLTPTPKPVNLRIRNTEIQISSVLPFLLLGPLARIGYFEALAATLEAKSLTSEAHVFAAGLAFKVLSPPARGWHRPTSDLAAAAAFAGLEETPSGDQLADLARKLTGQLSALESLVSYTLIQGHDPTKPILLIKTHEGTLVIVEIEGSFPITTATTLETLKPILRYFQDAHFLIEQESAEVGLLCELDASGFRFVTNAPPTRHEPWRVMRDAKRQYWYSNDRDTSENKLLAMSSQLAQMAEESALSWKAVCNERPAIPTDQKSDLERTLNLAASLALGTLSWSLWKDREMTTPLLALQRFADLEARVRFNSDSVEVRLPLGRRHRDLKDHGLLRDVWNLPWLGDRKVEFSGG